MNAYLLKIESKLGRFYIPCLITIMSFIIIVIGYSSVKPEDYSFQLNHVAEQTVQSPITIEDISQTELNRERARKSVTDVYAYQESIMTDQIDLVIKFFDLISDIRNQSYSNQELLDYAKNLNLRSQVLLQEQMSPREVNESVEFAQLNDQEQMIIFTYFLNSNEGQFSDLANKLSEDTISIINKMTEEDLTLIRNHLIEILTVTLSEDFQAIELSEVLNDVSKMTKEKKIPNNAKLVISELLNHFIVPTSIYSPEETLKKQEEAAASVPPSFILQGQVIIQEGHIINQNTLRQLDLLGLLTRESSQDALIIFVILVLLHSLILAYFLYHEEISITDKNMTMTAYASVFSAGFILLNLLEYIQNKGIEYALILFPMLFISMLMIEKVSRKFSTIFIIALNVLGLFIIYNGRNMNYVFVIVTFYLFNNLLALLFFEIYKSFNSLSKLLTYGLLANVLFTSTVMSILTMPILSETSLIIFALTIISLLLSVILYFFIEPYWTSLLASDAYLTLNNLANLNHPLLQKLIEMAPGSYHHSVMVASLASAASDAIGGNSQLASVASYYHDIGKIVHPLFFVENLAAGMESPHRFVTAHESAQIIIGHVTEGRKILENSRLPKSIIDICMQHHGTTQVKYFYHQAKQEDSHVNREDYTYPGPKPQSREAMIVMLADSVEAACRTLTSHSQESIEDLVNQIVQEKIDSKQFSDNTLSVNDLEIVKESLVKSIASMYHTRIEYPE